MKSFLRCFLLLGPLPILSLGLINILIDPYNVYGSPKLSFLNEKKPAYSNFERLAIPWKMKFEHPKVVVLGTSKVAGFIMNHEVFSNAPFASNVGAANIYEIFRLVQHASQNGSKEFLIGLDLFSFNIYWCNRPGWSESRLTVAADGKTNSKYDFSEILTLPWLRQTLKDSYQTIVTQAQETKNQAQDTVLESFRKSEEHFVDGIWFPDPVNKFSFREGTSNSLNTFEALLQFAKRNHLKITFVINPSHARYFYAMSAAGLWPAFEEWKKELARLTANPAASEYPVYDFSSFAGLNATDVGTAASNHIEEYGDSAHFNQKVGRATLDSIKDGRAIRLAPGTIEQHLAKQRVAREEWERKHTDEAREIQSLVSRLTSAAKNLPGSAICKQPTVTLAL